MISPPVSAPRSRRAAAAVACALAALLLAACAPREPGRVAGGRLKVVATTGMIADAARRVGGEAVTVEGLMGPGVDPHLYKASAGDVETLAGADLILYNGLHLEAAMAEVLSEMGRRRPTAAVAEAIDPDRLLAPAEYEGAYDPHVWFDVALWSVAVEAVEEALTSTDPTNAPGYVERSEAFRAELAELDEWVRRRAAELPEERRVLVTAHDAFNYFGRAYGFEVRGLQGISTASEAGTADVQALVGLIVERRIPALFVETSVPRRTIEAVVAGARSRGFTVEIGGSLFSDAMGNPGTPEGTYPGMVRHNVNVIVDSLLREVGSAAELAPRTAGRVASTGPSPRRTRTRSRSRTRNPVRIRPGTEPSRTDVNEYVNEYVYEPDAGTGR